MIPLVDIPGHLLLVHPNIPKPLHGLNPRTLLGQEWWDLRRRLAYARFNNRCWACMVYKQNAKFKQWLEAHECYFINYAQGTATFMGVCALCHSCHNYIHDGRLRAIYEKGKLNRRKYRDILNHGNRVLRDSKPRILFAKAIASSIQVPMMNNPFVDQTGLRINRLGQISSMAPWEKWRLIIQDQTYPTPYPSYEAWAQHYYGLKD